MRKVAFIDTFDKIKKLITYVSSDTVYLFGFDCVNDTSSISDYTFDTIEEAENHCAETYNIHEDDWIIISEPCTGCQDDFIMPTKVKGRENGTPQWGQYQTLVNHKWIDIAISNKSINFIGMTVKERLLVSGLLDEFDKAKINDKQKALKILKAHGFDTDSINKIVA
ncbi:hypothetical protein CNR22_16115 [Sphingobacteriaceae bacterium]|nr:hypothetical protein CNR22_16115 [Sphingobacteriaceae bacterium]